VSKKKEGENLGICRRGGDCVAMVEEVKRGPAGLGLYSW
jgi:hypothetical protein